MKKLFVILFTTALLSTGCSQRDRGLDCDTLTSINIVDRNGMSQTISSKDRLEKYEEVDFLQSCPYQKVMRIYQRDEKGNSSAYITSYHPNGQIKQYLEVKNSRASGAYREWFANGQQKLEALVIGGAADIDPASQRDWLFDGVCRAWNEEGNIMADIPYQKGVLEGEACYYHSNGQLSKKIPYNKGQIQGVTELFTVTGSLQQQSVYKNNIPEGVSVIFWEETGEKAAEETFKSGRLIQGAYFDKNGVNIASIEEGFGNRIIFNANGSYEKQTYRQGSLDGKIEEYSKLGALVKTYHMKNGLKHGEETFYYEHNPCAAFDPITYRPVPKISIPWYEGKVQGVAKTWYDNGVIESQREFSDNIRNGLSTAWYNDGSLMLIEEYESDKLLKGEYHRKGESRPSSRITDGKGICSLYNPDGHLIKKVNYTEGKPIR